MKKDLNIRVSPSSYRILRKLAKKEGRTIKGMFEKIVTEYGQPIAIHSISNSMPNIFPSPTKQ